MATPSFLQASASGRQILRPQAAFRIQRQHKTAKLRPPRSHICGPLSCATTPHFRGWAAFHMAIGHFAHASPAHSRGTLVSDQVGPTTVAPWSSRNRPAARCGDQKRGRSVSLPQPAYPPESSSGSAGAFQRGPCKTILQDMNQGSTASHYRQAKHDSQNLFTIASRIACRQP